MRIGKRSRRVSITIQGIVAILALSTHAAAQPIFSLKWAMDNDEYARQYSAPYSQDPMSKSFQLIQERIDARFQEGSYGVYFGGGGAAIHSAGGQVDMGLFSMPTSWSTLRGGITAMDYSELGAAGVSADFRIHAPTRFTPYIGIGGVAAMSGFHRGFYHSYSSYSPNARYRTLYPTGIAAFTPEAGISYWINSQTRFNLGASWYITGGRPVDFLQVGASMEFVTRPSVQPTYIPPPLPSEEDDTRSDYFYSNVPTVPYDSISRTDARTEQLAREYLAPQQTHSPVDLPNDSVSTAEKWGSNEGTADATGPATPAELVEGRYLVPRLVLPDILKSVAPVQDDKLAADTRSYATVPAKSAVAPASATTFTDRKTPDLNSSDCWLRDTSASPNR